MDPAGRGASLREVRLPLPGLQPGPCLLGRVAEGQPSPSRPLRRRSDP